MDSTIIKQISQETSLPETSVAAALTLMEGGASGPFVVRYCKEATGMLDESQIRAIQERMVYYRELDEKRKSLLKSLEEQGKATEDLRRLVEGCRDRIEIEDLSHRFRPKRKTRAAEAMEKGLEPLADYIWGQDPDAWSLEEHADVFIDSDKGIADRQQAIQGACEIIADWIAENFELRKALRELLWKEGHVVSTVVPAKASQRTKYNMYYDRREPVTTIPSHRVLAIRRGTKEGVLTSSIEGDNNRALQLIADFIIRDKESIFAPLLEAAARDSYSRILRPLIETEVRSMTKERADREAIRVFQENLENLLQSPPCGAIAVIGIETGKSEECHLAAVDPDGVFLEEAVAFPRPPRNDLEGTRTVLAEMIRKHNIGALAIGSGPEARETETILRGILAEEKLDAVIIAAVNDAGVVVYASSRIGREELPELGVATRSAVSLARRLQDPIAELVKIDPKLIGVGQYQHDVDQKELHRRLVQTVQFCVNRIGADLNKASFSQLRYISGLSDRVARRIVMHRSSVGSFPNRAALLSVPGIDEAVFRQASGFLRVADGDQALDRTSIHPDHYPLVERMAATLEIGIGELLGSQERISAIKLEDFVSEDTGLATLRLIHDELLLPGRDPRGAYAPPRIRTEIRDIAGLTEGMVLEGTVTNVTNFGAFIDIGIHQDGLVHLSQMSNRFIRDPREAVKVGDLVRVKVISVEVETKRIGLSMKALLPAIPRRRKKPRRQEMPPPNAVEAAASQPASTEAGAPPMAVAESVAEASQGARTRPTSRPLRPQRPPSADNRPRRRFERQARNPLPEPVSAPEPVEELPQGPEPSLQEKIAILQSKFRGIS